jgi:ferric-dicitrate binding protein FerR (iron transport regulator)
MEKNIPWRAIIEFLNSDRSGMDAELSAWLEERDEHKVFFEDIKVLHSLTGEVPKTFSPKKDLAWQNIEKRIIQKPARKSILPLLGRIAAAFALVLIGFSTSLIIRYSKDNNFTRVQSAMGNKTLVYLPDSSTVHLNGGTSIVYYADFLEKRYIELKGEALFDVTKDAGSPFTVHTDNLDVNVLGTKFNVMAFEEDSEMEVSLLEGKIGLSKNRRDIMTLSPGEIALYDKTARKVTKMTGDVSKVIAWSNDELIFDDNTLEEIVTYLERWYGVEIELEDALKGRHRFTFNIKTESLREMLDLINVILPIKYEINGKHVKIMNKN